MAAKPGKRRKSALDSAVGVLQRHFARLRVADLVAASRQYPMAARVDLQRAVDGLLSQFEGSRQLGVHAEYSHETLTLAHLLGNSHSRPVIGPLQYEEVDIGETLPVHCVRQALWLGAVDGVRFAMVISPAQRYGSLSGVHLEIAVPPGDKGAELARHILSEIENRVRSASSYRGKVLSLESLDRYSGAIGAIRVHKLRRVGAEELVLPQRTLALLDRNVAGFVAQREKLTSLGLQAKKGLLFYGPPGTGKTHTIHYLAAQLPNHTTLLVTAQEVGQLDHYFQLARFLQPSILVIEDVDLIARSREGMNSVCEEVLLNKLLNEMDGVREDAEILFVLTTNRPEQLESALASRPGRIDQAIEFPLPDDDGRRRLARLYSCGLDLQTQVAELIVRKTAGASAAFIKELMRRAAQFMLENGHSELQAQHVNSALQEMLFEGGSLNAKLLGGYGVAQPAQ